MHDLIINNVTLAPTGRETIGHGRCGTANITLDGLANRFGDPHARPAEDPTSDGKVTAIWYLDTPRGPAAVRDYWWNRPDEQSIAGSWQACLWAAAWLRCHGITATTRS